MYSRHENVGLQIELEKPVNTRPLIEIKVIQFIFFVLFLSLYGPIWFLYVFNTNKCFSFSSQIFIHSLPLLKFFLYFICPSLLHIVCIYKNFLFHLILMPATDTNFNSNTDTSNISPSKYTVEIYQKLLTNNYMPRNHIWEFIVYPLSKNGRTLYPHTFLLCDWLHNYKTCSNILKSSTTSEITGFGWRIFVYFFLPHTHSSI